MAPWIDCPGSVEAAERDQIVELKPFAERAMNAERARLRLALGFASCECWLHRQSLLHDSCHLDSQGKVIETTRFGSPANIAAGKSGGHGACQVTERHLIRLFLVQCVHGVDLGCMPRRKVVGQKRHRKEQHGDSGHHGGVERLYAV